jgi:hypothetical protein
VTIKLSSGLGSRSRSRLRLRNLSNGNRRFFDRNSGCVDDFNWRRGRGRLPNIFRRSRNRLRWGQRLS